MERHVHRFVATTVGGMEEVALDELGEKLPGVQPLRTEGGVRQGRIVFQYERAPRLLLALRAVHGVWAVLDEVHGVTVGRPGLERIAARVARLDVAAAQRLARVCRPEVDGARFQLSATVQGTHRFAAGEAAQAVSRVLVERHGLRPGADATSMPLHLQVTGKRAELTLRLAAAPPDPAPGGLGRTLTYCLGRLVDVRAQDAVAYLRCDGAGAVELGTAFGVAPVVGVHPQLEALRRARLRAGDGAGRCAWVAGGTNLPLGDGTIDLCLGLLPAPDQAEIAEWARLLQPGGVAAVVVPDARAFSPVLEALDLPLGIMAVLPIYLRRTRHAVFLLERLPEREDEGGLLQLGSAEGGAG